MKFKPMPKLKIPEDKPFKDLIKTFLVATGGIILLKAASDVLKK